MPATAMSISARFAFRAADADLSALDAVAAGLRAAGHVRITRTAALRYALATVAARFAPNVSLDAAPVAAPDAAP